MLASVLYISREARSKRTSPWTRFFRALIEIFVHRVLKKSRGTRGSHEITCAIRAIRGFLLRGSLLDGFSTNLFSRLALPGQCLLDPFLFPRFQVERVFLDFFDDVFLLNLTFEPPQGIFNGFSVLNPYFSQSVHPHSTWAMQ